MTDDELRLHLESLHASIFELHGVVSDNAKQIAQNSKQLEILGGYLAIDAENIRALARIAEAHERRLDDLEER